jgi:DNA ligase (NAD+)
MSPVEAHREAAELRDKISELADAYYARNELLVADAVYDELMRRLEEIEREFPEVQSQDSPTQLVGGSADSTLFAPVVHLERLYSLDNVFTVDELTEWMAKTERDAASASDALTEAHMRMAGGHVQTRKEAEEAARLLGPDAH